MASGQTIVYQLVMPEDANVEAGLISTASPIGRGLLGKEEGDEINIIAPNGSRRFELVKVDHDSRRVTLFLSFIRDDS